MILLLEYTTQRARQHWVTHVAHALHSCASRVSQVFTHKGKCDASSFWVWTLFFFLKLPYDPSTYLLASPSYSSKFVICKSSSSISLLLWIGPAWAPLRKFGYDDLSEVCSVWSSTVTVARAVTRVTVELDESESTAGVLWCWFCRLLLRPLLLWGPLLWRLRLPTESDDSSPCLVTMHSSESVGGVPCLQVEFGRNSLFDPTDEAVRGGETSSIFIIK